MPFLRAIGKGERERRYEAFLFFRLLFRRLSDGAGGRLADLAVRYWRHPEAFD